MSVYGNSSHHGYDPYRPTETVYGSSKENSAVNKSAKSTLEELRELFELSESLNGRLAALYKSELLKDVEENHYEYAVAQAAGNPVDNGFLTELAKAMSIAGDLVYSLDQIADNIKKEVPF